MFRLLSGWEIKNLPASGAEGWFGKQGRNDFFEASFCYQPTRISASNEEPAGLHVCKENSRVIAFEIKGAGGLSGWL